MRLVSGAWARTVRAGNLPTVWTNVLVGALVALPLTESVPPLGALALMLLTGSCAYMGGMALNDVFDLAFDQSIGAPRPLAEGLLKRRTVLLVAMALLAASFVAALGAACLAEQPAVYTAACAAALVFAIVNYNAMHRRHWALAALLMACCRILLVVLTAIALTGAVTGPLWIAAGAIGLWTAGITVLARGERGGEAHGRGWLVLFVAAALCTIPLYMVVAADAFRMLIAGLLILLVCWIPSIYGCRRQGRHTGAVLWSIAGLCVLDAALLASIGRLEAGCIAVVCGALCMILHRRVLGT